MGMKELVNSALAVFDEPVQTERLRLRALIECRARELKCAPTIKSLLGAYEREDARISREYARSADDVSAQLMTDGRGVPLQTMDNILMIMHNDEFYRSLRFNVITNCAEVIRNGAVCRWSDTDEAESLHYLERRYGIYAERKHTDALRILFREREYNPIADIINSVEWDGIERCEEFLIKWAKVDDTAYNREVSRLIFAGGINRLFLPGCKFDDVPILIGTAQGEGKSSLVKWLAINDEYFAEITDVDGQRSVEQLEGAWICEIAELLALTKAKEQEAVKSYITRQRDKYRKPYDRQVSELPRRCVFIGTTNNQHFLKDKTGNRRFYPVVVHSNGYELHDHEQEVRDYILQCWAEAAAKFRKGEMPNFANRELLEEFRAAQDDALEDDWRVGLIESYLSHQDAGALVCVVQVYREALNFGSDFLPKLTPKETQEIAAIIRNAKGWTDVGRKYTTGFGRQRCWQKAICTKETPETEEKLSELPF